MYFFGEITKVTILFQYDIILLHVEQYEKII